MPEKIYKRYQKIRKFYISFDRYFNGWIKTNENLISKNDFNRKPDNNIRLKKNFINYKITFKSFKNCFNCVSSKTAYARHPKVCTVGINWFSCISLWASYILKEKYYSII